MLSIRNFSKKYSDRLILSIPEVDFGEGAHWIKGENGAGKSTLLKAISGIIPFHGTISFKDGVSLVSNRKSYLQRVSYAEAEPLYPGFVTANDLLSFVGKARGSTKKEQQSVAGALGITDYLFAPTQTYSSGMLKKLSLALCFLGNPGVMVLDEPLITLDADSTEILLRMIRERYEKDATIFLISSHQPLLNHKLPLKSVLVIKDRSLVRENFVGEAANTGL